MEMLVNASCPGTCCERLTCVIVFDTRRQFSVDDEGYEVICDQLADPWGFDASYMV